ncbi:hypothetical protein SAMN05892877_12025 [Rhizobium subbaraonis]|uniref:Adenylate cyclase n=1 Tax=Rhizobium subbaraonis TaxID=908946 RepID=A0A285UVR6_9HYPH|nr:hypothetical protein [Rhizobium subbaraonis]SOC46015.1 hypothetical protein SAMN05892877_12025 [Rhizobium subbaraonis]
MNVQKPTKPRPGADGTALSGEDMLRVFELLQGATSVELKLMVPDSSRRAAVKGLAFDPVEAEPRQVYFFDTPDLALNKAGVVLRARRIQGGGGDTVVKLRPVDPSALDPELRKAAGFKIELDAMPGGYVCSASYKGACTGQEVLDVVEGKAPLVSLFSKEQRDFCTAHAPADIPMEALVPLGPTFLLRLKHQPKGFDRRLTIEFWLYPDGSRVFEVSTKCDTREAFQVGVEFRALMAKCGIPVEVSQEAKTNSALAFFSKELATGQPG